MERMGKFNIMPRLKQWFKSGFVIGEVERGLFYKLYQVKNSETFGHKQNQIFQAYSTPIFCNHQKAGFLGGK